MRGRTFCEGADKAAESILAASSEADASDTAAPAGCMYICEHYKDRERLTAADDASQVRFSRLQVSAARI